MTEDNPFEAAVSDPETKSTEPETKADAPAEKPKRTRSAAKPKAATGAAKPAKEKVIKLLSEHYDGATAYDERQGEIQGGVKLHNGVPVAWIKPVNWVGPEPLLIALDQLTDLRTVADGLIAQVEAS